MSDDNQQLSHVANRNQKSLTDHGQKLFNAINCFLNDEEQLELTEALFKYQNEHNVFTLVRCCREIFDTQRKKSLMLFMRPVIPIRDRFHYDEYYKLFFPDEFDSTLASSKSIFSDLIPKELIDKTIDKANKKRELSLKLQKQELDDAITSKKLDLDFNIDDLQKLKLETPKDSTADDDSLIKIAGFRIIELNLLNKTSLGFNICIGPTKTFIMISYVDLNSQVYKLGMRIGDELVSVNEISLKMQSLDYALNLLTTTTTNKSLKIVLQTSGFLPTDDHTQEQESLSVNNSNITIKWFDPFNYNINKNPLEMNLKMNSHVRNISIDYYDKNLYKDDLLGIQIRGGSEFELGIFISNVKLNSLGYKMGLKIGDQLLFINNKSLLHQTIEDVYYLIYDSLINLICKKIPIKLTVRYLGLLPFDTQNNNKLNDFNLNLLSFNNLIDDKLNNLFNNCNNLLFKHLFKLYLNNQLTIELLCLIIKYKLTNNQQQNEIIEKLREYVYDIDCDYYDRHMNIIKEQQEKELDEEKEFILIQHTRSYDDISRLINLSNDDYKENKNNEKSQIKLVKSISLDNLNYFL